MVRYRFDAFVLSPRQRTLLRSGVEQPLIPRYFDLLLFLVEHRADAVHKRDIFDAVWADVIVSESALTQAIRTVRRALGDDSRDPRFVRTVSRHGYQFVFPGVIEEEDSGGCPDLATDGVGGPPAAPHDPVPALLARLAARADSPAAEEDQREAAERLHALGTAMVLARLPAGAAGARARALLRDTRWDSPTSGPVPILGQPDAISTVRELVRLRTRRAAWIVARRWTNASVGGAVAGLCGGVLGGLLLLASPAHTSPPAVVPVLAALGAACGMVAGAGVGAGMAVAEAAIRSRRVSGLVVGSALGGGSVGLLLQMLGGSSLSVLVGVEAPVGGAVEGLVIGAAAAAGYGGSTADVHEGLATPRGPARVRVLLMTGLSTAGGALLIAVTGRPLVGGTLHAIAQAATGRDAFLGPLGGLIGEPGFGPVTATLIAMGEGLAFGVGLAWGLTRRP